jgi:hypothetical protein
MIKLDSSSVIGLSLPILIPRRGRGYVEAAGKFSVDLFSKSNNKVERVNALDIINILTDVANTTVDLSTLNELAKTLSRILEIPDIDIRLKFVYHLDRVSPSYKKSILELPCVYWLSYSDDFTSWSTTVDVPVRLYDTQPISGRVKYSVNNERGLYFETLLDQLHTAGVLLYPLSSSEDKSAILDIKEINKNINSLTTPSQLLDNIKIVSIRNKQHSGYAVITTTDIYGIYTLRYSKSW